MCSRGGAVTFFAPPLATRLSSLEALNLVFGSHEDFCDAVMDKLFPGHLSNLVCSSYRLLRSAEFPQDDRKINPIFSHFGAHPREAFIHDHHEALLYDFRVSCLYLGCLSHYKTLMALIFFFSSFLIVVVKSTVLYIL